MRLAVAVCQKVLAKLVTISDAPTATPFADRALGAKMSHTSESSIPDGTNLEAKPSAHYPPPKRLSLYAHYEWRMKRAVKHANVVELMGLATMATRDYLEYTGAYRPKRYEHHTEAVRELLTSWRGTHSREAATWLNVEEKWVRRHRTLNGCDADFGEERDKSNTVLEKVVALANGGASVRVIADAVGKSKSRVAEMLDGG